MDSSDSNNKKKIYIIIGVVAGLVLVFIAAYFFFRSQPQIGTEPSTFPQGTNSPENQENPNTPAENPNNTQGTTLRRLTEGPAVGAAPKKGEAILRYFEKATGHLYEVSFDGGEATRVSGVTIPGIQRAIWSPSQTYAVLTYYKDGGLLNHYTKYNKDGGVATSGFFPSTASNITFAPDQDKILYQVTNENVTNLITALPNNTQQQTILTTQIPDITLAWPTKNLISVQTRSSTFAASYLYSFVPSSSSLNKIFNESYGLESLWSPAGDELLVSTTESRVTGFYLYTTKNNNLKKFDFATLPEKCVWSKKLAHVFYCAVPQRIQGVDLPDVWWQGKIGFYDSIWKIDLESGKNTQLLKTYAIDIINLVTSDDEKYLFFSSKNDGSLWSLKIAE
jgi:hypothetical protein